ncbi:MAG: hypothetical protein CVT93_03995 [Bacteroidetes bacterium HGW-Bacteroidetes-10]|nr:MAG: hypothetical protein CVT93_03995 [Bacteroidetes bacterium HGW-Bacteroidetes-10]
MKKILKSAYRFALIILVLNLVIYIVKDLVFREYYKYSDKFDSYLLADSHGWKLHDFTERIGVANFSYHSESYSDIERKLTYLIHHEEVDTVFISVDDHTLSPYRDKSNNDYKSVKYEYTQGDFNLLDYAKFKLQYYVVIFDPNIRAIISHFFTEQGRKLISSGKGERIGIKDVPWPQMNAEQRDVLVEERYLEQFPSERHSDVLEKSLVDIIETCEENDITLIGIKFPLSGEYLDKLGERSYGADSVLAAHGIRVLDFSDSFRNNHNYFEDPDHLNPLGANKLIDFLILMHF